MNITEGKKHNLDDLDIEYYGGRFDKFVASLTDEEKEEFFDSFNDPYQFLKSNYNWKDDVGEEESEESLADASHSTKQEILAQEYLMSHNAEIDSDKQLLDENLYSALDRILYANLRMYNNYYLTLDTMYSMYAGKFRDQFIPEHKGLNRRSKQYKDELKAFQNRFLRGPQGTKSLGLFQPINLMIVGEPGGGKTGIIEDWAEDHSDLLHLDKKTAAEITLGIIRGVPYVKDEKNYSIDQFKSKAEAELQAANAAINSATTERDRELAEYRARKLADQYTAELKSLISEGQVDLSQVYVPSTFFNGLKRPDEFSVLFLDEINRMHVEAEASLLTLIQSHEIPGTYGVDYLDNMLFTIAACNPPGGSGETRNLSMAMNTRFMFYVWNSSPEETVNYLKKKIGNVKFAHKFQAAQSDSKNIKAHHDNEAKKLEDKIGILETLLEAGAIRFTTPEEIQQKFGELDQIHYDEGGKLDPVVTVLNARTLTEAIEACDGTPGLGTDKLGNPDPTSHNYARKGFLACIQQSAHPSNEQMEAMATALQKYQVKAIHANDVKQNLWEIFRAWDNTQKVGSNA